MLSGLARKLERDENSFAKDGDCTKQNADLAANALMAGDLVFAK